MGPGAAPHKTEVNAMDEIRRLRISDEDVIEAAGRHALPPDLAEAKAELVPGHDNQTNFDNVRISFIAHGYDLVADISTRLGEHVDMEVHEKDLIQAVNQGSVVVETMQDVPDETADDDDD